LLFFKLKPDLLADLSSLSFPFLQKGANNPDERCEKGHMGEVVTLPAAMRFNAEDVMNPGQVRLVFMSFVA
jgi:hypothetical protein